MARSFFTLTKDSELAQASNVFSNQITATPTVFGLTAGQASNYASLDLAFKTALDVATTPETRTKATVKAKNDAARPLRVSASYLAKIISGTPTVTDSQKINLGISVRATPTPVGPLGQPTGFKAGIDLATGALDLSWKNTNPRGASGATYQIWRRIGATGPFEYLIGTGGKKYTDNSIPAGSSQVQYKIQAVRSTSVGPVAQFIVNFGAGGSTTVTEESPVKLAA